MRFRLWKVAQAGDIAKAFLKIEVDPVDPDILWFLWAKDINAELPEIIFVRFNRVAFAVNSSPCLIVLFGTTLIHFRKSTLSFYVICLSIFYIDTLVIGANSEGEALGLY